MTSLTKGKSKINKANKTCWCRDAYAGIVNNYVICKYNREVVFNECKNNYLRKCRHKECFNAHSGDEIVISKYISSWDKLNKKNLDLIFYYNKMLNILEINKYKLLNDDLKEYNSLDKKNFIDVLKIWRNFNNKYSGLRKKAKYKNSWKGNSNPPLILGKYYFREEFPDLIFKEEDNMWALYRQFIKCKDHENMNKKIENGELLLVQELCIGHHNCKNGAHWDDQMICKDDFLIGNCNCKYKKDTPS